MLTRATTWRESKKLYICRNDVQLEADGISIGLDGCYDVYHKFRGPLSSGGLTRRTGCDLALKSLRHTSREEVMSLRDSCARNGMEDLAPWVVQQLCAVLVSQVDSNQELSSPGGARSTASVL